jgi:hypothetical protein
MALQLLAGLRSREGGRIGYFFLPGFRSAWAKSEPATLLTLLAWASFQ